MVKKMIYRDVFNNEYNKVIKSKYNYKKSSTRK
jgi:hypothetical protein